MKPQKNRKIEFLKDIRKKKSLALWECGNRTHQLVLLTSGVTYWGYPHQRTAFKDGEMILYTAHAIHCTDYEHIAADSCIQIIVIMAQPSQSQHLVIQRQRVYITEVSECVSEYNPLTMMVISMLLLINVEEQINQCNSGSKLIGLVPSNSTFYLAIVRPSTVQVGFFSEIRCLLILFVFCFCFDWA